MTDMEKVKIHGVPETMLQTLFARAAHSQKKEHKFYDEKAIEIVKQLDYDENKTPGENLKALSAALDGGTGLEKGLFQKIDGVDRCLFFDGVELIDHGVDLEEVQA